MYEYNVKTKAIKLFISCQSFICVSFTDSDKLALKSVTFIFSHPVLTPTPCVSENDLVTTLRYTNT